MWGPDLVIIVTVPWIFYQCGIYLTRSGGLCNYFIYELNEWQMDRLLSSIALQVRRTPLISMIEQNCNKSMNDSVNFDNLDLISFQTLFLDSIVSEFEFQNI